MQQQPGNLLKTYTHARNDELRGVLQCCRKVAALSLSGESQGASAASFGRKPVEKHSNVSIAEHPFRRYKRRRSGRTGVSHTVNRHCKPVRAMLVEASVWAPAGTSTGWRSSAIDQSLTSSREGGAPAVHAAEQSGRSLPEAAPEPSCTACTRAGGGTGGFITKIDGGEAASQSTGRSGA